MVLLLLCVCSTQLKAQEYHLRIILNSLPAGHTTDSIYVAGNFNRWNPADTTFIFKNTGNAYMLEISTLKPGNIEFKCTRGAWSKAETTAQGYGITNRSVQLLSDTTIEISIAGWEDDFIRVQQHTVSENVSIIDTAFDMPQLNRKGIIRIYLPADYAKAKHKKKYPVMYMQDGQNLFDSYGSFAGEWGVDETLDSLIQIGKPPCIIVAIDAGSHRVTEYNPFYFERFGEGQGKLYLDFIVKTLKPYIDKHYRTLSSKENTAIAGSSLGGLIAYYAMLAYPNVFGKAGVFSPAFWVAPAINDLTDSVGNKIDGKIFFYMGDKEGDDDEELMKKMADRIGTISNAIVYTVMDPEGKHNEAAWKKWFPEFYCWVMGDGFNNQVKLDQ